MGGAGAGMKGPVTVEPSAGAGDIARLLWCRPGRVPVAAGLGGRLTGGSGRYLVPLREVPPC